jgi:hypothetical protein
MHFHRIDRNPRLETHAPSGDEIARALHLRRRSPGTDRTLVEIPF